MKSSPIPADLEESGFISRLLEDSVLECGGCGHIMLRRF